MNIMKLKLFFAKCSKWIYAIFLVVCAVIIFLLICRFDLITKLGNCPAETVAVLGTLLGAIIGGIFTLAGSVYVNKRQLKAQTYIKKKNLIYKPLYDELRSIQNDILSANPFPDIIVFQTEDYGRLKIPQYTVWDRIKSDTRYLETPQKLVSEMEDLYLKINEYMKTRIGNNDEMTDLINSVFQEVIGTQSTIINIGDCVISYVLEDSKEDIYDYCKTSLKDKVDVSEEQKKE
ncbi:MAG: hypothetical protein Q4F78_06495 [Bacillota bacterium]|nr:hypothetical protein [Bacillota bacterium]